MAGATDPRGSIPKAQPAVLLVAAATNVAVHTRSATGTARTFKVKKLLAYNGQAIAVVVSFGTGVVGAGAITETLPRMRIEAAMTESFTEDQLPNYEFEADFVAQASAAGAGAAAVRVQAEVEEIGG